MVSRLTYKATLNDKIKTLTYRCTVIIWALMSETSKRSTKTRRDYKLYMNLSILKRDNSHMTLPSMIYCFGLLPLLILILYRRRRNIEQIRTEQNNLYNDITDNKKD